MPTFAAPAFLSRMRRPSTKAVGTSLMVLGPVLIALGLGTFLLALLPNLWQR